MKKMLLFIGLALASMTVLASTDDPLTQRTTAKAEFDPGSYQQFAQVDLPTGNDSLVDKTGVKYAEDTGKAFAAGATNVESWSVSLYGTYFPDGPKNGVGTMGGGLFVTYKIKGNPYVSAGLGLDYMNGGKQKGRLTMPSGNITAKYPIDVGRYVGLSTNTLVVVPIALAALAMPLSGAGDNNGGVAAIAGTGVLIPLPKVVKVFGKSTTFSVGYLCAKWINAGPYDGAHHEFFVTGKF